MKEYVRHKGKNVGYIQGDRFHTGRDRSTIFWKYKGIGISQDVLDEVKAKGVTILEINITLKEKTTKYLVRLENINSCDTYDNYGDIQRIVSLVELRDFDKGYRHPTLLQMTQDMPAKKAGVV